MYSGGNQDPRGRGVSADSAPPTQPGMRGPQEAPAEAKWVSDDIKNVCYRHGIISELRKKAELCDVCYFHLECFIKREGHFLAVLFVH